MARRRIPSKRKKHKNRQSPTHAPVDDALLEKKAAMIAGSILSAISAGLVAWGILEFLLLQ
jgi:hypothetical protein